MRNLHIVLAFSFLFVLSSAISQNGFLKQQDEIFSAAVNQEMCLRIGITGKNADCDFPGQSWKLPNSDTLYFFDSTILISKDEREQFKNLIFPNGNCDRFFKLASLCDLYFPLYSKKISARGLHKDCRWIPLVLSGCNPSYKSQQGTAGMWAMDFLVTRKNHLRVDKFIDERCGGDFTTDAATAYLKELAGLFNGDNIKMLLAYINGVPALNGLEKRTDLMSWLDQDSGLQIKFMAYVKALMESARLFNKLQNYFDVFGEYDGVFCDEDIRFEAMTALLGISEQELGIWNPVYCGRSLIGGYRKIPFMIEVSKVTRFNELRDSLTNWQPPLPILPIVVEPTFVYYKVKRGDSIGKIAQRNKISVSELKRINGLKGNTIQHGKMLKIPVKQVLVIDNSKVIPPTKPDVVENMEPTKSDSTTKVIQDNQVKKGVKPKPKATEKKVIYVVKSGDSLWKIAKKYKGVTEKDIMKWNKIGTNLKPGQRLTIYPN